MADQNAAVSPKSKKPGLMKRMKRFFTETKSELKRVTWPTKKQLFHNTIVILVFIVIMKVILSLVDVGFNELIQAFVGLFS